MAHICKMLGVRIRPLPLRSGDENAYFDDRPWLDSRERESQPRSSQGCLVESDQTVVTHIEV